MKDIIKRYLDNNLAPGEEQNLLIWLREDAENRQLFLDVYHVWVSVKTTENKPDKEKAWLSFIERINEYEYQTGEKKKKRFWLLTAVAAMLLFAVMFSVFVQKHEKENETYVHSIRATHKEKVILPDQTIVWLSPDSKLSYPDEFTDRTRSISFEGEALFNVAEDKEKPFIIDLGEEEIKVLGTTFNVKNTPADDNHEVVLVSGSISLYFTDTKSSYRMEANDKITYSNEKRIPKIEKTDASLYSIKMQERLVFDNTPLSKVVNHLEIWYGVRIEYPRKLAEKTYVTFTVVDESLEQTMKMLSVVAPVKYSITGKDVLLVEN